MQQTNSSLEGLIVAVSRSLKLHTHTHTHTVGLPWTSNQPVARAASYTKHNTKERNTYVFSGLRTRNTSIHSAADLRLRPQGPPASAYTYVTRTTFRRNLLLPSLRYKNTSLRVIRLYFLHVFCRLTDFYPPKTETTILYIC